MAPTAAAGGPTRRTLLPPRWTYRAISDAGGCRRDVGGCRAGRGPPRLGRARCTATLGGRSGPGSLLHVGSTRTEVSHVPGYTVVTLGGGGRAAVALGVRRRRVVAHVTQLDGEDGDRA